MEKGGACPISFGIEEGPIQRQTQRTVTMVYLASARAQHHEAGSLRECAAAELPSSAG